MIPLIVRFWKPAAALILGATIWFAVHHYGAQRFSAGYQQAVSEDAKALADSKLKYDAQVKADEDRITNAAHQHELDLAQLALVRARPVEHVVCRRATSNSSAVPATAGLPESHPPGDRTLPPQADGSADPEFDPTVALYAIADEADEKNAACRMLNQAVHGMPSAP